MPFCHPDKIVISNRFREADPKDVEELSKSIKEIGQLQPVIVDNLESMTLIAGFHRRQACKLLNRDVWFETEETAKLLLGSPQKRRMAELQENLNRRDFTDTQKNLGMAELHELMQSIYGPAARGPKPMTGEAGWSQTDTANKLGLKSHRTISDAITIKKAIDMEIPGVATASTTQEKLSIIKKHIKIEAAAEMAARRGNDSTGEISNPIEFFGNKIILGDCLEKMKELPANLCNFFITDPPWKISADEVVQSRGGSGQAESSYDDSSDTIIPLVKAVIKEMSRVGKSDCYVIMFCGAAHWLDLCGTFRENGFSAYNKPLVWFKADPTSGAVCSSKSPAPSIWPASITDFMILARKGNPVLAQLHKGDGFLCSPCASADKFHQAQKPIALMEQIINRFYHPATQPVLIDPFAGSGSTLIAARRVGIKHYFGYELSPQNRERAIAYMVNQYMDEQKAGDIDMGDFE